MSERLSAPPLIDRELRAAGFGKRAAMEVKAAARDYPGVPVSADGRQVTWSPCAGYASR